MIQATQIRVGMIILHAGELCRVLTIQHITQGNKRGKMQVDMRRLRDGIKLENRFRSEDSVERATLEEKEMEYLYREGATYHFMDTTTFEQTQMLQEALGNAIHYMQPNTKVMVDFYEEQPVGVEIPSLMIQTVVETDPTMKGATAARGYKPAKLDNGLTVKVPQFIQVGDKIKVDTNTNEYSERV